MAFGLVRKTTEDDKPHHLQASERHARIRLPPVGNAT